MNILNQKSAIKKEKIFLCENCDFSCYKESDLKRHNLTSKHLKRCILNEKAPKSADEKKTFICNICNKEYKNRNGLWYHKKSCNKNETNNTIELDINI